MKIALIHASRAAVDPVAEYYKTHAPDIGTVNLLDDGVMRYLDAREWARAENRLISLIGQTQREYGTRLALLTCSALPVEVLERIRAVASIPVLKIDEPMARAAVGRGRRIAVVATFPATVETTHELLAAAASGPVEVRSVLSAEALQALLHGDRATHDRLFFEAVHLALAEPADALVLAQVSMARLHDAVQKLTAVPVFSSLRSSLEAVQGLLAAPNPPTLKISG